jgi:hypothetical protein
LLGVATVCIFTAHHRVASINFLNRSLAMWTPPALLFFPLLVRKVLTVNALQSVNFCLPLPEFFLRSLKPFVFNPNLSKILRALHLAPSLPSRRE